jgi:hypothetical protein
MLGLQRVLMSLCVVCHLVCCLLGYPECFPICIPSSCVSFGFLNAMFLMSQCMHVARGIQSQGFHYWLVTIVMTAATSKSFLTSQSNLLNLPRPALDDSSALVFERHHKAGCTLFTVPAAPSIPPSGDSTSTGFPNNQLSSALRICCQTVPDNG